MQIETDLWIARPLELNNGYTFTLASRLGDMLHRAEQLFGPRDASYTILGIEFTTGPYPQVWYPGDRRYIVIQLTMQCLVEPVRAFYQLAHECIHLLAPTGGRNANVLEEGLATYFSETYLSQTFGASIPAELASYTKACSDVRRLLAIDQNLIRTVRLKQPSFHLITTNDVLAVRSDTPRELVDSLVAPFIRE